MNGLLSEGYASVVRRSKRRQWSRGGRYRRLPAGASCDEEQFVRIMGVDGPLFRRALPYIRQAQVRAPDCMHHPSATTASSTEKALIAHPVLPYVDPHYWLLYSISAFATER